MDAQSSPNSRHTQLLERLQSRGWVDTQELCDFLGVSEATVRRDLTELERKGLLQRTHGGALAPRQITQEYPNADRMVRNAAEKARIGKLAAQFVKAGDAVFIDAGTTTLNLAHNLAGRSDLTFVTNGTDIITALTSVDPAAKLYVAAGEYHDFNHSLTGVLAAASIRGFNVDRLFLSVSAVDLNRGQIAISSPALAEAQRAMIEIAQEVIVLADHTKFARAALAVIAPLSKVDRIVTDNAARDLLTTMPADVAAKLVFA